MLPARNLSTIRIITIVQFVVNRKLLGCFTRMFDVGEFLRAVERQNSAQLQSLVPMGPAMPQKYRHLAVPIGKVLAISSGMTSVMRFSLHDTITTRTRTGVARPDGAASKCMHRATV